MIMSGVTGTGNHLKIMTAAIERTIKMITILNRILKTRLKRNSISPANLFVILKVKHRSS